MKLTGGRIESFVKSPPLSVQAILVYGPDRGLALERLEILTKGVVPDLSDPFRIVDLEGAALKNDPARLADEAAAIAMTGGRRAIRVRNAGDAQTKIFDAFLKAPMGDALILAEAGDLGPKSSLRKLFEGADNAAALPCYADDEAALSRVIREALKERGLSVEPDALSFLGENLGADRGVTRSEIEKLTLYMGDAKTVRLEDAAAAIGDGSALSLDDFVMAAAEGNHADAQRMLERLFREGGASIAILRALLRHFQRLQLVLAMIDKGQSPDKALSALRPPLHFRIQGRFRNQINRWSTPRVSVALDLIVAAEIECKKTGAPDQALCGRLALQLAAAANAGRR